MMEFAFRTMGGRYEIVVKQKDGQRPDDFFNSVLAALDFVRDRLDKYDPNKTPGCPKR